MEQPDADTLPFHHLMALQVCRQHWRYWDIPRLTGHCPLCCDVQSLSFWSCTSLEAHTTVFGSTCCWFGHVRHSLLMQGIWCVLGRFEWTKKLHWTPTRYKCFIIAELGMRVWVRACVRACVHVKMNYQQEKPKVTIRMYLSTTFILIYFFRAIVLSMWGRWLFSWLWRWLLFR